MQTCIVRIENGGYKGWQVRIGIGDSSVKYNSKMFADSKFGGVRKARTAAQTYLVEERKKLGLPDRGPKKGRKGMLFVDQPDRISTMNTSGVTGVYRSFGVRTNTKSKLTYRFWAAVYRIGPDGKPTHRQKRFLYGVSRSEKAAFDLAVRFRKGYEQALLKDGARGVKRFFREWVTADYE